MECCGNDEVREEDPITFEEYSEFFRGLKKNRVQYRTTLCYGMINCGGLQRCHDKV